MKKRGAGAYRYGFNGKENDNSTGEGNLDFGARILDVRLGRWLSVDPSWRKYPNETPYMYSGDNPIIFADPDGKDRILRIYAIVNDNKTFLGTITYKELTWKTSDYNENVHLKTNRVQDITINLDNSKLFASDEQIVEKDGVPYNIAGKGGEIASNNISKAWSLLGSLVGTKDKDAGGIIEVSKNGEGTGTSRVVGHPDLEPVQIDVLMDAMEMYGKIPGTKVKPSGSDIVEEFSKNKSLFAPLKVTENLVKLIKTADKLNTKQGTDNSLKATTQQQTQKAIPKVTQGKDGTLIATPGRKDSIGKDGRIWDVPTLIPINKSKN